MTTINWTSGAGNKIEISFAAMYELDLQGRRKAFGRKVVVVMATVDGSIIQHMGLQHCDHAVAVAKVGIIGLVAANRDLYVAAEAAVEATIAGHNAAYDAHSDSLDQVDADCDSLTRRMAHGESK